MVKAIVRNHTISRVWMIVAAAILMIAAALASRPAAAVDFAVDAHAGTMGTGIGGAFGLTDHLNLRFGLNSYDLDVDIEDEEGLDYDAGMDLDNQYVFLDIHPFEGNFRLTAGMFINNNEISASAIVDDAFTQIGNDTALQGTRVDTSVTFDNNSGYVGIGWGNSFNGGMFDFGVDLGIVMQGSPKIGLDVTLPPSAATSVDNCAAGDTSCIGNDDIEQERLDAENEAKDFDSYPLINFSFSIRFL